MLWQDFVVAAANFLFTLSLVSQVWHGFKAKKGFILLRTSGLTVIGLYAIALCFLTLSLFFSAAVTALNGTLWLCIFIQRLVYRKA
ncbi:MAG TPA: hypothetical protein ENN46_03385 [Candidatus Woesearchaeota archaeon]|nr:hypothetical protein [Candidatus Woesearchaeota archaeon]